MLPHGEKYTQSAQQIPMVLATGKQETGSNLWDSSIVHIQSYSFPVLMNGCESWAIKKAECRRIDVFEL